MRYLKYIHQSHNRSMMKKFFFSFSVEIGIAAFIAWLYQILAGICCRNSVTIKNFHPHSFKPNEQKKVASVRLLLESDSFRQINSQKVTLLTEILFKNENKTGKLSQAVNSYNVDFVIALLLNEWDVFANYSLLEGLVKKRSFSTYDFKMIVNFNPFRLQ